MALRGYKVALPENLYGQVRAAAKSNGHSMGRELLMRVVQSFCFEADVEHARHMARAVAGEFELLKHTAIVGRGRRRGSDQAALALELLRKAVSKEGKRLTDGARAVRLTTWRRYCLASGISSTDKVDTNRRALVRARQYLEDMGRIGMRDGWVWPT